MHVLDVACFLNLYRVIWVGIPKVIVMRSKLGEDGSGAGGDVGVDTASVPWVELAVEEHDVRRVSEVSSWVAAAKEISGPVVHWREAILLLAVLGEAILVEIAPVPSLAIGQWHWQLVAGLNLPSTTVEDVIFVCLVIQLNASVSLPDLVHGSEPLNILEIES